MAWSGAGAEESRGFVMYVAPGEPPPPVTALCPLLLSSSPQLLLAPVSSQGNKFSRTQPLTRRC
ncbi:GL15336 [Drosophila persimilis]|uniref:GL15336 n=1 Tax=Drosophila persimilis TaxID=7234 RepID=B4GPQ2_DROPE|nr:GL15336 [Drosophila persimilis]